MSQEIWLHSVLSSKVRSHIIFLSPVLYINHSLDWCFMNFMYLALINHSGATLLTRTKCLRSSNTLWQFQTITQRLQLSFHLSMCTVHHFAPLQDVKYQKQRKYSRTFYFVISIYVWAKVWFMCVLADCISANGLKSWNIYD